MEVKALNVKMEELKAMLVRLWAAGAICYFVFFGTNASNDLFDSVFFGALFHFLLDEIVISPLIKGAFKTKANLRKNYTKMTSIRRIVLWLYEFFEMALTVLLTIYTYQGINQFAIKVNWVTDGATFITVEPIGYAIIFTFIYYIFYFIKYKFTLNMIQGKEI